MEKYFVPYQESLELKKLGFDEECICTYSEHDRKLSRCPSHNMEDLPILDEPYFWKNSEIHKTNITAPTWEQAFKFFRDKYDSHHSIMRLPQGAIDAAKGKLKKYWFVSKDDLNPPIPKHCDGKSDTYEEARLECLKQLIKIVKDGK
jgi:hypothetical protein